MTDTLPSNLENRKAFFLRGRPLRPLRFAALPFLRLSFHASLLPFLLPFCLHVWLRAFCFFLWEADQLFAFPGFCGAFRGAFHAFRFWRCGFFRLLCCFPC